MSRPLGFAKAPARSLFVCALAWLAFALPALGRGTPPAAAIASAHPLATKAGFATLAAGGNAFDAAIAVAAALAVVEPYSSGLGGGGFWLLQRGRDAHPVMLDGRERAPLAARRDMYLDPAGAPVPRLSVDGPLAAGIPGVPAALAHLAEHYGRLALAQTLEPAIALARDGFALDAVYGDMARFRLDALRRSPAAAAQFLQAGNVPSEGTLLRQPDLAETLERLALEGRDGFYAGAFAGRLVAGVRAAGGIWSLKDLREYRVAERAPVRGEYRGRRIVSASLPSSGGVVLLQMLNMLSGYDLESLDAPTRSHLLVEVMRRAYRDRAAFLGDPDFVEVPVRRLLHPFYASGLARDIDLARATAGPRMPLLDAAEAADTTHYSILDQEGNRVAATLSINYPFGSAFVPPRTGVLLNDEMDDFAMRPGVANLYGLIGGAANAIAPGKRMLSSMTPTFVEWDEGVAILGTPGGSRIITMVLSAVLAAIEGKHPEEWVGMARFHHQYLPNEIQHEPAAFTPAQRDALKAMGHRLREVPPERFGNMQVVFWDKLRGRVLAASDPRGVGAAAVRPAPRRAEPNNATR